MKRALLYLLLFSSMALQAQILEPAKWSSKPSTTSANAGDVIELIFDVKIDKDWYLYSSEFPCEDGPIPTSFTYEPNAGYELVGGIIPVNPIDKYDDIFECDVKVFKKTAQFRQKVKLLGKGVVIKGVFEYQVCTEVDGRCVPGDGEFLFDKIEVNGGAVVPQIKESTEVTSPIIIDDNSNKETVEYGDNKGPFIDESVLDGENSLNNESFLGYLIFAFFLGLTSLITPCVFPMIPMTVTFFLKDGQSKSQGIRYALIFGVSIILIYTLAGTVFAFALGAEGLNALATHWAPNLFVFAIFIVFALSFLGLFEITAPHKLVNKVDQQAEKGGLVGVFFMAATLVLVSFSCTLPIVGNVVVLAAGGDVLKPILAMFSYALAFAIPFTLFAVFPEWIKGLPKSGGWLNSVKVTLGFLELALCLKFFSIADQAYHWGILDRDTNIILWIVIFGLLGFYFLGKIKLPHDSPVDKVTVPRLFLAILTFSFVVYLVPGLWGAPLKALAGYIPPKYTLDFDLVSDNSQSGGNESCEEPKYADFLHLPHGLQGYFDYDQALACARKLNKPLFIDFTGHGCTNCREMEAVVWSDPQVLQRLRNDYVIVALYVDDKTELPESEWFTSAYDNKVKKTLGKQNADLQIANLENNAQPFYVLVGADEKVLAWPYGYDKDPEKFADFLDSGTRKYRELYGN
ncbi:MAG: thioredoxin family protein [Cyclobacteriaceae bacterium]|nr:thioredoxin family protein [Cyclobacteriaceae bacterium]